MIKALFTSGLMLYSLSCPLFSMPKETSQEWELSHAATTAENDAGVALRAILSQVAQNKKAAIINIPKGTYHFYPESAPEQTLYISNHDQQASHRIGIPLQNAQNLTIKGNGSTFVFHGLMLPFLIMDSSNITLSDIRIAVDSPLAREGRVLSTTADSITLQFPTKPDWSVENGKLYFHGKGWKTRPNHALGFSPNGAMLAHGLAGDIPWLYPAEQVSKNAVRFSTGDKLKKYHLNEGDTLVLRSYWRPHPAMVLYRAQDTILNNVIFHDSLGMALIAQRSENIHINGGGCVRAPGRMHTAGADATHFSNCKGLILVENALYEGMMDDAINVHATCPAITEIISPTQIVATFMHGQAYGFEIAAPGENLTFIHGKTLENTAITCKVQSVEAIDPKRIKITLETPLPAGIGLGDAVENADWHPQVIFRNNTVRHNRARGALFTTPKPVLVEGNHFDHSSGSAILLAGDAQGWYESGRCQDVCIRNNIFEHNLTALYQFTNAIISICPEVKEPDNQRVQYHDNVRIENNTFITHRVPLLYAISASRVNFRNNNIIYNNQYPEIGTPQPFIMEYCNGMLLEAPIPHKP